MDPERYFLNWKWRFSSQLSLPSGFFPQRFGKMIQRDAQPPPRNPQDVGLSRYVEFWGLYFSEQSCQSSHSESIQFVPQAASLKMGSIYMEEVSVAPASNVHGFHRLRSVTLLQQKSPWVNLRRPVWSQFKIAPIWNAHLSWRKVEWGWVLVQFVWPFGASCLSYVCHIFMMLKKKWKEAQGDWQFFGACLRRNPQDVSFCRGDQHQGPECARSVQHSDWDSLEKNSPGMSSLWV